MYMLDLFSHNYEAAKPQVVCAKKGLTYLVAIGPVPVN